MGPRKQGMQHRKKRPPDDGEERFQGDSRGTEGARRDIFEKMKLMK